MSQNIGFYSINIKEDELMLKTGRVSGFGLIIPLVGHNGKSGTPRHTSHDQLTMLTMVVLLLTLEW